MDTVFDQNLPKVDQQSEPEVGEPELGKELCLKERIVLLCSLALDDYFFFHQEVQSEAATEVCTFVNNRQLLLSFYLYSPKTKFKNQCFFVYALQKPGAPQKAMNFNRSIDNDFTDFVFRHHLCFLCASASLRLCVNFFLTRISSTLQALR